ncbi:MULTISPECIES: hypothetical protein [unclassified Nocardiopsis]|uniref:hypothetical protein n=1 Tax=Nocardiopsis TaxID=2013 RepID=UPI00387B95E8
MNPVLQEHATPSDQGHPRRLHQAITALAEQDVNVFVFADEGRLLDASPAYAEQPVEQIAAICSGLVTGAHRCARLGRPARTNEASSVVIRYTSASVVLLPITDQIWAGCMSGPDQVIRTAHALALFAEQAAPLVPKTVGWSLPAMTATGIGGGSR